MKPECVVPGCAKPQKGAKDLCGMHVERMRAHGSTDDPRPTREQRFWAKVEKTEACWLWTAKLNNQGYPMFAAYGPLMLAHRFAYTWLVGPIPAGLHLDHLCRVPRCVNPTHLEPVTNRVNVLRGMSVSAIAVRTNRCPRGHEFTPENTYLVPPERKHRRCRQCVRIRVRRKAAA